MPNRNPIPPVLNGRSKALRAHFERDYQDALQRELQLPREQRFVTNIGPSYAAIGWLLRRDNKYSRPKGRS